MYNPEEMICRIKQLKRERKLSNETLSVLSGVPKGTLAKILGSETKDPQISNIIKIAQALGVSADYIIFGKIDSNTEQSDQLLSSLSEEEIRVFSLYKNLCSHDQGRVLGYIEQLYGNSEFIKESPKIIKIAARDGSFTETTITDDEAKRISDLPDVDDL